MNECLVCLDKILLVQNNVCLPVCLFGCLFIYLIYLDSGTSRQSTVSDRDDLIYDFYVGNTLVNSSREPVIQHYFYRADDIIVKVVVHNEGENDIISYLIGHFYICIMMF